MSFFPDKRIVPVLMFHSVGLQNYPWIFSHISESVELFEAKIKVIKNRKFNTILWDDLYWYMNRKKSLPRNSIMLTFDDGYLDNWIYVYPYLKRYQFKATIFVNPEFVDPGNEKRLNLDDVWEGRCNIIDLKPAGFLNWKEMREMESSGLVDIQSHSLTHTWYFNGPKIVDYHKPAVISAYPWIFWNKKTKQKPFYLTEEQQDFIRYGYPVFEHEKALIARQYYPDERLVSELIDFVETNGGKKFFSQNDWRKKLDNLTGKLNKDRSYNGEYESESDYIQRVKHELDDSKALIEKNLEKKVEFICWPGGGYNNAVLKLAREAGYKSWTISSRDLSSFRNLPGADAENIKRLGTSNKISIKGYGNGYGGPLYQFLNINAHRNSLIAKQLLRIYKLVFVFNKGNQDALC